MKESRAPLMIAIVLLVLPLLYVGSYLIAVRSAKEAAAVNLLVLKGESPEYYRFGGEWSPRIYRPLEWIDRRLRPGLWAQLDPVRIQIFLTEPIFINGPSPELPDHSE